MILAIFVDIVYHNFSRWESLRDRAVPPGSQRTLYFPGKIRQGIISEISVSRQPYPISLKRKDRIHDPLGNRTGKTASPR